MAGESQLLPDGATWVTARVFYPANVYRHPASGLVQLRLVRRGSSYADIDLGAGTRRVFTRPGDLLLSLPDRPTTFGIEDSRELTLLQVAPSLAAEFIRECGGANLDDLTPLLRRPVRDSLVAEILRRLETSEHDSAAAQRWAIGVVFASLLRAADKIKAASTPVPLSEETLAALLVRINASLADQWSVDRMADTVGISRRIFASSFKHALGMPAHQYLLRLRADHAAELLRASALPIAEVAVRAGFAHQAHMTRTLNRLKGLTPGQIRNAVRTEGT